MLAKSKSLHRNVTAPPAFCFPPPTFLYFAPANQETFHCGAIIDTTPALLKSPWSTVNKTQLEFLPISPNNETHLLRKLGIGYSAPELAATQGHAARLALTYLRAYLAAWYNNNHHHYHHHHHLHITTTNLHDPSPKYEPLTNQPTH
ncbi:hypothetical protein BBAD15_g9843 [Beauveria bassiana D1-5]|uniref:Uncharacterized protein n=1 Tax=Beauveria bassiana D1-5 TaxID=1245745 RepID=A0A0A2VEZ5_BEABA|nr:hypothetical protein BBAD15_g9843 [Beauveria bassiana D1-5]